MSSRIEFHGTVVIDADEGTVILVQKNGKEESLGQLMLSQLEIHPEEDSVTEFSMGNVHILVWQDQ